MIAPVRALDRWWLSPMPAERLASLRILVGLFALGYVLARFGHLVSYGSFSAGAFRPIGVVALLPRPLPAPVVVAIAAACVAAGVLFVVGLRFRWTGPAFAALLLWTLTYRNSWGMIFHTENLLVLHVIVLAFTPAADAFSVDARRAAIVREPGARYGWPVRLLCIIAVVTYVLAGIAKLRFGGTGWIDGEVLRAYVATDNLRKILLGSGHSPLAVPVLAYPGAFSVLAAMTLAVELGSPLALLGRRAAAVWVTAAIAFHWGVLALMVIAFPYPMSGVGFACFFSTERLVHRLRETLARRRVASSAERVPPSAR